ncbi:hypothetical protein AKJ64_02295 [candidate division MSBL1 archaeon SCGC-AAA259E17]|uniref:Secondary thiamine-phosphate synthase enzyme n=2 Tax=candidate division MSBL1 TaxID=215777 RepID=A0A133UF06_9EURY|nr:hypothetical protein AKJ57_03105 [candidate division MSBL1 archaeon SCGC-AAA259A05]KXA92764.1 hypothetical protein AKJ64_02295 [candidate division MSBL1 archaeon SCGC-AAA259E17]
MFSDEFSLESDERVEIRDISSEVQGIVDESGTRNGFVLVYTGHVTACLSINEDDPELLEDIRDNLLRLVPIEPEEGVYRHNEKYSSMPQEQNTHAHVISSMIKPFLAIPVEEGNLNLGNWQSLFFIELDGSRRRRVTVQVWGDSGE